MVMVEIVGNIKRLDCHKIKDSVCVVIFIRDWDGQKEGGGGEMLSTGGLKG